MLKKGRFGRERPTFMTGFERRRTRANMVMDTQTGEY